MNHQDLISMASNLKKLSERVEKLADRLARGEAHFDSFDVEWYDICEQLSHELDSAAGVDFLGPQE